MVKERLEQFGATLVGSNPEELWRLSQGRNG
jgi:hypothetical protein